jgi:hypothetical protein
MSKLSIPCAALLVLAAACGKSSQVRASLTDAPIDNVSKFEVTISEVRFHDDAEESVNGGEDKAPTAAADHKDADDDGARGKGWVVLCTGTQTFDLMTLRPTTTGAKVFAALCGGASVSVTPGKIDALWLDVTKVHVVLTSGVVYDFTPPHGVGSGLKIEIDDEDLSSGGDTVLKIDFDAAASFIANLDGSFSVKPKLTKLHR